MIEVNDITKFYSKDQEVLKGICLNVKAGEIFGLLGPNGAGKTTLMQILATLLKPTSGSVRICGMNPETELLDIHRKLGFLTTEIKLDPLSTPDKLFDFFAELYDIKKDDAKKRKASLFKDLGVEEFKNKRIIELSTGMKQKVSIAISLIHNPPVIIFDEPTNGLDILTQKQVTDYLLKLKEDGHAIILSTHIFSVAESLCDRIGILIDGKIVATGTRDELISASSARNFEEAFFNFYVENHRE